MPDKFVDRVTRVGMHILNMLTLSTSDLSQIMSEGDEPSVASKALWDRHVIQSAYVIGLLRSGILIGMIVRLYVVYTSVYLNRAHGPAGLGYVDLLVIAMAVHTIIGFVLCAKKTVARSPWCLPAQAVIDLVIGVLFIASTAVPATDMYVVLLLPMLFASEHLRAIRIVISLLAVALAYILSLVSIFSSSGYMGNAADQSWRFIVCTAVPRLLLIAFMALVIGRYRRYVSIGYDYLVRAVKGLHGTVTIRTEILRAKDRTDICMRCTPIIRLHLSRGFGGMGFLNTRKEQFACTYSYAVADRSDHQAELRKVGGTPRHYHDSARSRNDHVTKLAMQCRHIGDSRIVGSPRAIAQRDDDHVQTLVKLVFAGSYCGHRAFLLYNVQADHVDEEPVTTLSRIFALAVSATLDHRNALQEERKPGSVHQSFLDLVTLASDLYQIDYSLLLYLLHVCDYRADYGAVLVLGHGDDRFRLTATANRCNLEDLDLTEQLATLDRWILETQTQQADNISTDRLAGLQLYTSTPGARCQVATEEAATMLVEAATCACNDCALWNTKHIVIPLVAEDRVSGLVVLGDVAHSSLPARSEHEPNLVSLWWMRRRAVESDQRQRHKAKLTTIMTYVGAQAHLRRHLYSDLQDVTRALRLEEGRDSLVEATTDAVDRLDEIIRRLQAEADDLAVLGLLPDADVLATWETNLVSTVRKVLSNGDQSGGTKRVYHYPRPSKKQILAGVPEQLVAYVLKELLLNAAKHTEETDRIVVRTYDEIPPSLMFLSPGLAARASDYVVLVVEDHGKGFDQSDVPGLCEPFHGTTGSLGLGWAIATLMCDGFGGKFMPYSRGAGKGALCAVILPRVQQGGC